MVWRVAGLQPYFFYGGLIFLAGLAQESWRDLAAVIRIRIHTKMSWIRNTDFDPLTFSGPKPTAEIQWLSLWLFLSHLGLRSKPYQTN